MRQYLILLIALFLFTNCDWRKDQLTMDEKCVNLKTSTYDGKKELLDYIEKLKKEFESDGRSRFTGMNYLEDSWPISMPLISYWLTRNGYKIPSENFFLERMKKFNMDDSLIQTAWEKGEDDIEFAFMINGTDGLSDTSFFFSLSYRFIFKVKFGEMIVDVTDGGEYITCFNESIFHLNKYIFNDDKRSLEWLKKNDIDLLKDLVTYGGYDHDYAINRAVIDSVYTKYRERVGYRDDKLIYNLFARKDMNEKFYISDNLMKTVVEMTTKENHEYLDWLSYIGDKVAGIIKGEYDSGSFYMYDDYQCLKILSYICYYVETAYIKNNITYSDDNWNIRSCLSFQLTDTPQFLPFLQKHNYFGLEGYEKMVKDRLKQYEEQWG